MKKLFLPTGITLALSLFIVVPLFAHAQGFVPLTGIPGVQEIANTSSFPVFFNTLYKLCIGACATLAVIQIIWGGALWMTSGGGSGIEQAKKKITGAVLGLLLVLSPVIFFNLVDPKILDLKINVSGLQTGTFTNQNSNTGTTGGNQNGGGNQTGGASNNSGNPSSQPSSFTKTFSANAGEYIIAVGQHLSDFPNCYYVGFHSYASQQSCQAALSNSQAADAQLHADAHYYYSCSQAQGGDVTITASEQICN